MKKRLSLLLATLMVISMLPMSAFAVGKPVAIPQNYTTQDDDKQVNVAFEFTGKTGVLEKLAVPQSLKFVLTNGAKFQETAPGSGTYKPVTLTWDGGNPGTIDIDPDTVGDQKTVAPISETVAIINITNTADMSIADTEKKTLGFQFNVDFTDASEGDVYLDIADTTAVVPQADSVGSQKVKIASVKSVDDAALATKVKDAEKAMSFDGGELSEFEVYNFPKDTNKLVLETDKGLNWAADTKVVPFGGLTATVATGTGTNKLEITIAGTVNNKGMVMVFPKFQPVGRKISEGPVVVDIETTGTGKSASNRAVIGKVVDFNVTMTVVEKGKKEIPSVWGGETADVRIKLTGPKGSISNREIEFKVDGADVVYQPSIPTQNDAAGMAPKFLSTSTKPTDLKLYGDPKEKDYVYAAGKWPETVFRNKEFAVGSATGFEKLEEVYFDLKIKTVGSKDGVATITAAQRGWEAKADLAKVTPKFKATAELNPIKKGEARATSDVVITEAKAGLLLKGERLTLAFDTKRDYTAFTSKDIKIEATNGMKFDTSKTEVEWIKSKDTKTTIGISVPVLKSSFGEAAVITVSGLNVSVDGSATDDVIKLDLDLLTKKGVSHGKVASPEYIKVVKEYALESITTVFTIGQTQYTKNGQAMTAASAPYIKNGKTMLPIRAVAEALGLAVQWNGATKTATFSDATKVAAVTIGAEKMFVNGTPVPLAAKAELVNGTTFVELRSLSTAFGVQIDWDAAAKTATVSK